MKWNLSVSLGIVEESTVQYEGGKLLLKAEHKEGFFSFQIYL